ncbi:hypothetical protein SLEP1_g46439 [Rubroshorea leprosula]|uniref:Retrovirus-related Pol polyprotein from transposon TNT 1-94-like beta-barrel domain-containing protein n=1 Tax=Rubroshorea leprosula TaxID=152421 RepID=A0AAV5LM74_9ROSI|nr:hypothetical protein SLEP1_g46439 [Rubroshorea leprosula]
MQTNTMKYSIKLFDGKNDFALWQSTVKEVLTCQGLNAVLEETKPAEMKDSDWNTIQKKVASQIWLTLALEVKYNFLSETTLIGMWKKLEEIYASKSLTNQLYLKMELYQLKMAEGTNIHKHLFDFNMMVTKVVNVGGILEEEKKALLLLTSLPKPYKSLLQSMIVGKTTLVMKDVTTMLLENDKFLGEDGANQNNALMMEQSWGRSNEHRGGGNRERGLGKITMATNEKVNIEHIGDVRLNVHNRRAKILKNARYVPKCSNNIIALSELTTRGYKHNIYVLKKHPKRRLNKTMRKMVWKPKGILVDGKEINMTKKRVSFNNEVVFDDCSRR